MTTSSQVLAEVSRMTKLYKSFAEVESTLAGIVKLENQASELTNIVTSLRDEVGGLKAKKSKLNKDIPLLEKTYKEKEDVEVAELGKLLATQIKEAQDLVADTIQIKDDHVEGMKLEAIRLRNRNQQLQEVIGTKESLLADLEGKIKSAQDKIQSILGDK